MLVDEIIHHKPRRENPPAAQLVVQEANPRMPISMPGPSTSRSSRTLKKSRDTRAQHTPYYPSPSISSSFTHPGTAPGPTRMASDASDSPVQSPSSSRRLLKSRPGSTVSLTNTANNPSFPSPSSPVPQTSASNPSPVSPFIPTPIPQAPATLSSLPDARTRNATQFGNLERPQPGSTPTRPLLSPLEFSDTPTIEVSSEPRKIGVEPPLVPRYSKVKSQRWILWALYLLLGIGNLVLALLMRDKFPRWNPQENIAEMPITQRSDVPQSQPPKELVDLWKIAPLLNVLVTCGLLTIYWAVDKWYPVTFISRPLPEMLFYLVLFGIQVATTVNQASYIEPPIQWLVNVYHLDQRDQEELKVEARISSVFMSIQGLIVLLALCVVACHIMHHIRQDGSKEVLKHPTCRYVPHAPSASAFFASPFDTSRFKNEISSASLPV